MTGIYPAVFICRDGSIEQRQIQGCHKYIVPCPINETGHVDDVRFVDVGRVLAGLPSKPPPPFPRREFMNVGSEHGVMIFVELPFVREGDGIRTELIPLDWAIGHGCKP